MKIKALPILIFTALVFVSCGGGGGGSEGGSDGNDTFDVIGTVSVPEGQQSLMTAQAFTNTALDGAHVNVCTIQDGALEPLPAHPTVLADASGSFVISVDKNDVPANRQIWVCAAPPNSDAYTVLAAIPPDLLPEDLTEISTVSVNPNTNTTLITRYACGQSIMLFNANKCLETNQTDIDVLNDALDDYSDRNPGMTPDLRDLSELLSDIAYDSEMRTILEAWLSEVSDLGYDDFISDAQSFTNPTIPDPNIPDPESGEDSVSISGFACDFSSGGEGIIEATVAVAGSAGGGNIDVFTVFFTFDGEALLSPDTLGCGNWQQSGGLGTCSKLSFSSDTTNYIGTSSFLYNEGFEPGSISVQVKGFQSGSPTVLASVQDTVTCQ